MFKGSFVFLFEGGATFDRFSVFRKTVISDDNRQLVGKKITKENPGYVMFL